MGGSTDKAAGSAEGTTSTATAEASSSRGSGLGRSSPRTRERVKSVVEDQGVYRSTCGYCKSTARSSVAQGLWAYSLTVQDYQDLLDRGWRRSGMFLYKPRMKSTCCPPYTIRLKAESFVANKDQMRVLRRMQRYLDGKLGGVRTVGELHKEEGDISERAKGMPNDNHVASVSDRNPSDCETLPLDLLPPPGSGKDVSGVTMAEEEKVLERLKAAIEASLKLCVVSGLLPLTSDLPAVSVKRVAQKVKGKLRNVEGEFDYTSNIAFVLVALIRRKNKSVVQNNEKEQKVPTSSELKPQEIAEMLVERILELRDPSGFTVKASNGHLNFCLPSCNILNSKPLKQEEQAHKADIGKRSGGRSKKQLTSVLQLLAKSSASVPQVEVRMKRSCFDAAEFALYKKYQVRVHNDRPGDVKESSYRRFLVDSPLIFVPPANDGSTPSCGFGSFHQQYLVNGRLVAVGVVDVLPNCLSSKYLFWDPDFAFLSLGKYSALQEIKWVQESQKICSSLEYYYLGFYIHSCPKMRYKAAYYPSELLCPERFRWVPYELALPVLDKQAYVCLSDIATRPLTMAAGSASPERGHDQETFSFSSLDNENRESDMDVEADFSRVEGLEKMDERLDAILDTDTRQPVDDLLGPLNDVQLYLNGACLSFKHLQELGLVSRFHVDTLVHHLHRYLQVVGPTVARRMAYVLS